ncbi:MULTISPECIES: hypothetical protein [Cecembia]|uniref:Uncharacterized protein n=2 Tax=Cecembia TaxID=1187078 RepID=A0A4Q7P5V6_9BACT|nr:MULTISPECIES: hypothetical protein [Cecembia]PSL03030.1 hypothetical protein CLV48_108140 [Cecembia rubra]RZS95354.1 hypothetical protein BC751_0876 [Cecembia calidifontis]
MGAITKKALPGSDPNNARTALGIESKAVFKYTYYFGHLFSQNIEILFFTGVEACTG